MTMIVQQVTEALNGRFQVQPVTYRKDAFAAVTENGPLDIAGQASSAGDPFKKLVQTEVSTAGARRLHRH